MKNIRYLIISALFIMFSLNIKAGLGNSLSPSDIAIKTAMLSFLSSTHPTVGIPSDYMKNILQRSESSTETPSDSFIQEQYLIELVKPTTPEYDRNKYIDTKLNHELALLINNGEGTSVIDMREKATKAKQFILAADTALYSDDEKAVHEIIQNSANHTEAFWMTCDHLKKYEHEPNRQKTSNKIPDDGLQKVKVQAQHYLDLFKQLNIQEPPSNQEPNNAVQASHIQELPSTQEPNNDVQANHIQELPSTQEPNNDVQASHIQELPSTQEPNNDVQTDHSK